MGEGSGGVDVEEQLSVGSSISKDESKCGNTLDCPDNSERLRGNTMPPEDTNMFSQSTTENRRSFFKRSSALTAALSLSGTSVSSSAANTGEPIPSVSFGPYRISRLIVGSNPICGYSHLNRLMSQIMSDYFTVDQVVMFLRHCTEVGITTFQSSYSDKIDKSLRRFREQGHQIQWICLANGDLLTDPNALHELIRTHKPIGIAHHGGVTDTRFRERQMDKVEEFLKRVRDTGVQVGLSTHNPKVVEYVEEENWDLDFYMTCFYQVTRTKSELKAELGRVPLGETYLADDPDRMCSMIRKTRRTCLGFKILAAGRRCENDSQVENAFEFAFDNIKPIDATIVGMFPLYKDHPKINAALTRKHGIV